MSREQEGRTEGRSQGREKGILRNFLREQRKKFPAARRCCRAACKRRRGGKRMALFQHPFLKISHSSDGTSEICHPTLDLSPITFYHALWMTFAICRPPEPGKQAVTGYPDSRTPVRPCQLHHRLGRSRSASPTATARDCHQIVGKEEGGTIVITQRRRRRSGNCKTWVLEKSEPDICTLQSDGNVSDTQ